jgi:hypothetical protein
MRSLPERFLKVSGTDDRFESQFFKPGASAIQADRREQVAVDKRNEAVRDRPDRWSAAMRNYSSVFHGTNG